ncbi:MAG TPA: A24 family peptidase [Streptosporangiaceae bacterium]|jgi:leader peptidase (prepilin peptidase)/N-methyltransferase
MRPLLIVLLAAAGLLIGPLLRLIVVRLSVPAGDPWRTTCPACDASLPPTKTAAGPTVRLPALPPAGRCRSCRARLGPPPLSVELASAVVLGLLATRIHPALVLAAACWLAVCVIPLAFVDAATRRLPDLITAPAYLGTAGLLLAAAATGDGGHWPTLGRALLGGVAYLGFCLVLFFISPSGMGAGDVKLAASLGTALAWFSWGTLLTGAFAGFLAGALYSIGLLVSGRASRKTTIPFGPFMIAGTLLLVLLN